MTETEREGWAWPLQARKAHYFVGWKSLCRRWLFAGLLTEEQATLPKPGPDDCVPCHRAALKRKAAA